MCWATPVPPHTADIGVADSSAWIEKTLSLLLSRVWTSFCRRSCHTALKHLHVLRPPPSHSTMTSFWRGWTLLVKTQGQANGE